MYGVQCSRVRICTDSVHFLTIIIVLCTLYMTLCNTQYTLSIVITMDTIQVKTSIYSGLFENLKFLEIKIVLSKHHLRSLTNLSSLLFRGFFWSSKNFSFAMKFFHLFYFIILCTWFVFFLLFSCLMFSNFAEDLRNEV